MTFLYFQKEVLVLQLFLSNLPQFFWLKLKPYDYSDFRLKTEEKVSLLFIFQWQKFEKIGKISIWISFCFWVSPPNYTNYVSDTAIWCTMTGLAELSL